jgi:urea carboxylase
MEGPGGYQFVGRTIQVWSRFRQDPPFEPGTPWLLRFFDRIRWYPVDADELLDARADMAAGRFDVRIDPGTFHLGRYQDMLRAEADSIASFQDRQRQAFATEREAWRRAGEFEPRDEPAAAAAFDAVAAPPGGAVVEAPMTASVWKVDVTVGQHVTAGQPLVVLEAMKTETALVAPIDGVVLQVLVEPGRQVAAGTPTVVIGAAA